jgi:hypothetical protein
MHKKHTINQQLHEEMNLQMLDNLSVSTKEKPRNLEYEDEMKKDV